MIELPANTPAVRETMPLILGAVAAQVIGGLAAQMSPFVIAGYMQGLALSERDAGILASVEYLVLALTAISLAPLLPRLSYRHVGLLAVGLTLVAQSASIFGGGWTVQLFLRGVAGIGEGMLYAMSLSIVATLSSNPEKIFGYFQIIWAIGSVALFAVGGELTAAFAHRGILALLAGVTLLLAPFLFLVPNVKAIEDGDAVAEFSFRSSLLGTMLFAAIALYVAVSAALYAFTAPLGERAGLSTSAVGYALTIASLLGLGGAGAATVLNVRWGRSIPISIFFVGYALVAFALCHSRDSATYAAALVGSVFLYYFSLPYLFGLAAALDRNGRWAAAAGAAYLLGFAAGPTLAGTVIAATDYTSLGIVCVVVIGISWVLTMIIVHRSSTAKSGLENHAC